MQNAKRTPPHTDGVVVMFVVIIILYKKRLVNTQNYEILYTIYIFCNFAKEANIFFTPTLLNSTVTS